MTVTIMNELCRTVQKHSQQEKKEKCCQLITTWWRVGSDGGGGCRSDPADPIVLWGSAGNAWFRRTFDHVREETVDIDFEWTMFCDSSVEAAGQCCGLLIAGSKLASARAALCLRFCSWTKFPGAAMVIEGVRFGDLSISALCRWCGPVGFDSSLPPNPAGSLRNQVGRDENQHLWVRGHDSWPEKGGVPPGRGGDSASGGAGDRLADRCGVCSDADSALICCGEVWAEPKGKSSNLPVEFRSYSP